MRSPQSAFEGLNRSRDELGAQIRATESRAAGDYEIGDQLKSGELEAPSTL